MSVKVHEAYCLDSQQDRLLWFDDFLGDQLQDEWRGAGTGSAVVVDQQTGGICRITTGAVSGNAHQIDWNNIRSLLVSKKITFESRLKLTQTGNLNVYQGLTSGVDYIDFVFDTNSGHTNWYIRTLDVGLTLLNSGIAFDTDYHIFRIECFPTGEVHFFIDGIETANSPITTNITTDYLQPIFYIRTREDATKSMDVDYVVIRQEI